MVNRRSTSKRRSYEIPAHVGDAVLDDLLNRLSNPFFNGFKVDYLRSELLRKFNSSDGVSARERRSKAIEKWLSVEQRNLQTNQRLTSDVDFGWVTSSRFFDYCRKQISKILGPCEPLKLFKKLVVTSGASTSTNRSPVSSVLKLADKMHVTEDALKWWLPLITGTLLGNRGGNTIFEVVSGNKIFTVPKNASIDRVACKEPDVNLILQRAVGEHMRIRLRSRGIDLNDQSVNRSLAQRAVNLGLATIDLSSASDSVTCELIRRLLPNDWADVLFDIRSPTTTIGDTTHVNEMISSMGNGCTFELESLIFYVTTIATCYFSGVKGKVSVYGDDIIAPSSVVPRLIRLYHWLGFRVNTDKTHWKGHFRESCGGHYYRGHDVTPVYLRKPIRRLDTLILFLNEIAEWSSRGFGFIVDPEITVWWSKWSALVPKRFRGGMDFHSPVALVTSDKEHTVLVYRQKLVNTSTLLGAYKLWHIRRLNSSDVVVTSEFMTEAGLYERRVYNRHFGGDILLHRMNIS